MNITLAAIRSCLEGVVPSVIATCAPDGAPNVAYLSHVHFVDDAHVALSFQFFSKTRENVLVNPRATVQVVDPVQGSYYRLTLEYLRTEREGALFEIMKARLAGIASHTGMSKVFRLQGSDVYRVLGIERVSPDLLPVAPPARSALAALRACSRPLTGCQDLAVLLDGLLADVERHFGIRHSMILMADERGERLFTVASRGYAQSGVGSEIALGEGVIGVAARERTPIRIGHMAQEYLYSRAMREAFRAGAQAQDIETEIPLPGLQESHSQLAVPIVRARRLLGVLYVESPEDLRFSYEDEDALAALADQVALAIHLIQQGTESTDAASAPRANANPKGSPATIRHYPADHSLFIDGDYLIKGVAGAILWKLLRDYSDEKRTEFSNRELRLDASLGLPDIGDNLEARLILLQRRLTDRCPFMRIEKTGRGRFQLKIERPLKLTESPGAAKY